MFSNVWSENTALFERLMEIHSNSPKLYYGFKRYILFFTNLPKLYIDLDICLCLTGFIELDFVRVYEFTGISFSPCRSLLTAPRRAAQSPPYTQTWSQCLVPSASDMHSLPLICEANTHKGEEMFL